MSKICVVGLGYIGIPTAIMFSSKGFEVVGVDISNNVVQSINNNILPIEEKGLDELFKKHPFKASTTIIPSDIYIICVGTPIDSNNNVNLEAVIQATKSISHFIKKSDLVILESTVAPGTTNDVVLPILEKENLKAGIDFNLVHSPERVIPGNLLYELKNNDRIMGGISKKGAIKAKTLYESFVLGNIYLTNALTAETSKLMENTYRNINIAFANEVAIICEKFKINAWQVIELANKHPRVNILSPGPGVGGHCIPVDPWFIVEKAPLQSPLIKLSLEKNRSMPEYTVNKLFNILQKKTKLNICLLGCTYKANTDDIRESPSFEIYNLLKKDNNVSLYDPHVKDYHKKSLYETCENADAIVLLVDHKEFANIDYDKLLRVMKKNIILDCKNFISKEIVTSAGFLYYLLGDGSL